MFKPLFPGRGWRVARIAVALSGLLAGNAWAADVEITADYRPSENRGEFRNTTPNSGYCREFGCASGIFSVALPISYERTVLSGLPPIPQRWSLQTPRETTVNVVSDRGDTAALQLQITHVAEALTEGSSPLTKFNNPAAHYSAGGGCTWLTGATYDGDTSDSGFVWQVNDPRSPSLCYPTSSYVTKQESVTPWVRSFSVGYKLVLPRPHTMAMGTYHGSVTFSVGEAGDFTLGNNVTNLSTNSVTFNFTLTVHHELQVQFPANSDRVVLEPTTGWQKWLDTGVPPTKVAGSLPYRLTTSGPFSITMNCAEQGIGESCVIRNERNNEFVYFGVMFYPPKGLERAEYPGEEAPWREALVHGRPAGYLTRGLVSSALGKFEFYALYDQVVKLASSPGDKWAGLVTLIFDARL